MSASLALVADIGGTNARFALIDLGDSSARMRHEATLPAAAYASLQHAAQAYLAQMGATPERAAIAVASPVTGDSIKLTNRAWSFNRHDLRTALGLQSLLLLNDFGAVAWAVPALHGTDGCMALYGPARGTLQGPVTVIGPGTGLGVALLVDGGDGAWRVVETEGGHVSFAPQDDEERGIERWMAARHGRTSNERVLCGAGIAETDAVLRGVPVGDAAALRNPAEIVAAALDGHDVAARRTLARVCAVLGSVCGDTALAHGARTVMIAGGIVPRFVPFVRSSAFRERFLAKGRFAPWLEQVAVHVVTHPHPGLLGAAVALHQHTRQATP